MRIAIIGGHPVALEAVAMWRNEGAQVDWFVPQDFVCPQWQSDLLFFPEMPYGEQTIYNYHHQIYLPALQKLLQEGVAKNNNLLAVHKTFLARAEIPNNKTRMLDTFRVVYEVIPSGDIGLNSQGQALPSPLLQHLNRPYERFIDVDFVIDCRGSNHRHQHSGAGGNFALGERYLEKNIFYNYPNELALQAISQNSTPLLIVGSGVTAARWICALEQILFQKEVYLVTQETTPFAKFKQEYAFGYLRQKLDDIFRRLQAERKGNFKFYLAHNVMGIDQLQDQDELFVTIDRPHFRQSGPTINDELKTLRAGQLIVATGFLPDYSIYDGTRLQLPISESDGPLCPEPGLYVMSLGKPGAQCEGYDSFRQQLESVRQDVERFFSKK